MPMTNYILTPEDVDLIRQAVEKVLGRSISYAGQIALENLTNQDDLRNNVQIIIGESLQSGASGLTITFNATTGITTLTLDPDLAALSLLSTTGLVARTGNGTVAARSITGATGIAVIDGNGVAGNPQITPANDLFALESLSSTGFAVRTGAEAWAQRSITAGTGLAVTNGDGVAGNPSIIPANDLAALESLSGTGIPVRTGSETWAQRSITGSQNIVVVDGDGVAGNPTIQLAVSPDIQGLRVSTLTTSANYNATANDYVILVSATATVNLPAAATFDGQIYAIRNIGSGTVTIDPSGTEQIDGTATKSLAAGEFSTIVCDGAQWFTIG